MIDIIKRLRDKTGLGIYALAQKYGVSHGYIYKLKTRSILTAKQVELLKQIRQDAELTDSELIQLMLEHSSDRDRSSKGNVE